MGQDQQSPEASVPRNAYSMLTGEVRTVIPAELARALEKRPDTQRVDAGPPFPGPASVTTG